MIRWTGTGGILVLELVLASAVIPVCANADEALFGYVTTTDSLPEGRIDYQQWNTLRDGKAEGSYRAFDLRTGIGSGVTNAFQTVFYMNSSYLHAKNVYDPANVSKNLDVPGQFNVNGVSLEMKYRFFSPYKDPVGFSCLLEPEIDVRDPERGIYQTSGVLNFRLIGQKNYLDDQAVLAANFAVSPKWNQTTIEASKKSTVTEGDLGGSYRVARNWSIGVEFRNRREFAQQNFGSQTYSAYFLGPTVHYGAKTWWTTLAVMPQISGRPLGLGQDASGNPIQDSSRYLGKLEKFEVRLKIGLNLSEFM